VIAGVFASADPVAARGRLIRTLGARQGLEVPSVASLAQDARGFLSIGSVGGLLRYDGRRSVASRPRCS
jgi:ligand-binding sensor domain-containing protein